MDSMLKIMFIDDEINILNGLRDSFDWSDMGYEIIAEASSVSQAFDLFYKTVPDVIVTDICINEGSGLDFIKQVKCISPSTEFVVLSGYPNFEYAKQAIEYGVFSYLLKPIKSTEFIDTMIKIREKILHKNIKNSELFFYKLLQTDNPTTSDIDNMINTYDVRFPKSSYFIVTIQKHNHADDSIFYENLSKKIYTCFANIHTTFICQPQNHHISMLVFCANANKKNVVCSNILKLINSIDSNPVPVSMGVSGSFEEITDAKEAYIQSLYCLSRKEDFKDDIIYYTNDSKSSYEDSLSSIISLTHDEFSKILQGISSLNYALIDTSLASLFNRIDQQENLDVSITKNILSELAVQIIYTAAPDIKSRHLIWGTQISPLYDIQKMQQLNDVKQYIYNLIKAVFRHSSLLLAENYSDVVRDTIIYIMTNYPFNISIDTISNNINVSRHHLMRIFKKETGFTITDFITNYRINIAIELLESGEQNVSQVAAQVGYLDVNYFSKVFKKITGVSPKTILKKEGKQDV